MARRRRTSAVEDLVELASRLPWWVALTLALFSYLLFHAYATSPLPSVTDPRQMGQHLTSSMFRGLAMAGQYSLPLVFACGAIGSAFARIHRRKLLANAAAAIKPGQVIDGLSWREFEMLIGEVFRRKGYRVSESGGAVPDGGVDLVLHKDGEKYLVQCKHWRSMKVGVAVVREFFGVMAAEGAVGGFIVTSGLMTSDSREFSRGRNIEIVEGERLSKWISSVRGTTGGAVAQQVRPVSVSSFTLCPICSSEMILRVAKRGVNAGGNFWGARNFQCVKA